MNTLDKYLKLFTPVEKGLPEDEGYYVVIVSVAHGKFIHTLYFNNSKEWISNFKEECITHYLNLNNICLKSAALNLAEEAHSRGVRYIGNYFEEDDFREFIQEKQKEL